MDPWGWQLLRLMIPNLFHLMYWSADRSMVNCLAAIPLRERLAQDVQSPPKRDLEQVLGLADGDSSLVRSVVLDPS